MANKMKIIKTYWVSTEFDMIKHCIEVFHPYDMEVPENATQEEINEKAKLKDVIIIK